MSGIVGLWNRDGAPASSVLLESLNRTLAYRGPDGAHQWIDGAIGFACQLSHVTPESADEAQPLVHPSGQTLVFDGRLDNRDEILALTRDAPHITSRSPDCDLVLALYQRHGERFVEHLTGDFALALFDLNRRTLLLARDALGIRPLYYTITRRHVVFASEIKALLAHPYVEARPNDDMLACYLLGSRPEDTSMTCFRNIASLPPAHLAGITADGCSLRRYWDFTVTERRFHSFQDYADALRGHFSNAVLRRMRSAHPVAVSVSGGLDSSSILCVAETLRRAAPNASPAVLGLSYLSPDGSPSDEKQFLGDLERHCSIAIERLPAGRPGMMDGCFDAVWHIEAPFLDQQWNTMHGFFRAARQRGTRVMLTGHWADQVLFPQAYLVDLFRQLRWREAVAHIREFGRWMTDTEPQCFTRRFWLDLVKYHVPNVFVPYLRQLRAGRPPAWYAHSIRRLARRHVPRQPVLGAHLPNAHSRSLYEEVRSSYQVRCMEWNNKVAAMHGLEMTFPFLDRDLLSFLMSIPGEVLTWKGVPKGLLREAMRGILPDPIVNRTWKADFTQVVNEGMLLDYPQLIGHLESGPAAVKWGYLDADVLYALLPTFRSQLRSRTAEAAWMLSDLLGLELWLQVFFERSRNRFGRLAGIHEPAILAS
jgi:asparagine synthase (glutamine-hydrolysing)